MLLTCALLAVGAAQDDAIVQLGADAALLRSAGGDLELLTSNTQRVRIEADGGLICSASALELCSEVAALRAELDGLVQRYGLEHPGPSLVLSKTRVRVSRGAESARLDADLAAVNAATSELLLAAQQPHLRR